MRKVALIGLGRWGKNHLRELVGLGCEVIIVLHSQNTETEAWLKENYPKVAFTYDKEVVKNNASLKEVVIATPMETHFELSRECVLAGKKVFVEKPITDSSDDASRLLALADEQKAQFMVGQIFLYHDCLLAVKEALQHQSVTGVSALKTRRNAEKSNTSKQLFLDSFIHEVSVFLKLFGNPTKVSYQEKEDTLICEFSTFTARATIVQPKGDEKIRKFEFITDKNEYLWQNDELFEKGGSASLCKPTQSALFTELDIFLNRYEEWEKEINANNRIAVESVRVLEKVLKIV